VALALFVATAVSGCAGGGADSEAPLQVVTTVAPITSIVSGIVGEHAQVVGLVPEGTNSHTFEPPPSAAAHLAEADVVFLNGLLLEEPTRELADANVAAGTPIVELGGETITPEEYIYDFSFPEEGGKPNPHLWTNPPMAARYGEIVAETMVELDPDHAEDYRANLTAFEQRVEALDQAMVTATATVPVERRRLLTYHDAYAYFAEHYGWSVVGAIQPSSFAEPTARDVADLIDQVRGHDVPAVFGSEVFPSPVLEQIGQETGARYIDVLRDDDLPREPGDPEHSWLGLMRFDYVTMVEALGGDPGALEAVVVTDGAADGAEYPQ
jgi:ABC-type Zn uptake system ZnuABC Zn-binding protein ZnuA